MAEIEEYLPDLAYYFPYAIYAIVVGAIIMGLAQDHKALAIYCITMATVLLIVYIWDVDQIF